MERDGTIAATNKICAYLQRQVLDASYCPIRGAVRSFHLDKLLGIDVNSERLNNVLPDDDDL